MSTHLGEQTMNLLLVDDEPTILKTISRFLVAHGHCVRTTSSGIEALHRMEEETPDVVISDITMPGINGLDLLERIKVRFVSTPVILITGYSTEDTAVAALQQGAYDYLRKPVKLENLISILDQIDERRRIEKN